MSRLRFRDKRPPSKLEDRSLFAFPSCSSLATLAFSISRTSISCVTFHFAGSVSVLPA